MKRITVILSLLTVVLMACSLGGGATSSEPAGGDSADTSGASGNTKRGNAEFSITGAQQVDDRDPGGADPALNGLGAAWSLSAIQPRRASPPPSKRASHDVATS